MPEPASHDLAAVSQSRPSWFEWVCLGIAGAVLVLFRLHAFDLPLETDECNYAYIGARLLAGDRLYVDVWDHQPFGVFVLFAWIIRVFGDAPEVFRWTATGFSLATLGLIFAILRRIGGSAPAILGALLFAMVSSDPGTAGEGCNREIFMNTLILAAWCLALQAPGRWHWTTFGAGVALALASALKPIVAVHWALLAVWIALRPIGNQTGSDLSRGLKPATQIDRGSRARSALTSLAAFAAGPLVLWGGTFAYFALTDRFHEFIDAVFLANLSYSETPESYFIRFVRFFGPPRHPFTFDSAMPLWVGAIVACVWLVVESIRQQSRRAVAVLLLVIGGYVAVCLPARFWPHYYYLMIPPAVIAVSLLVGRLLSWTQAVSRARSRHVGGHLPVQLGTVVSVLLYLALPAALLATEYRDYLSQPPFGITLKRYNSRDFWGRAQGENIERVTDPGDTIFVFGNDASIYYYARRRCASRYTMITGLSARMAGAQRRRKTLMAELRERQPRVIIVLFDERPFEAWKVFLSNHYGEPVGWDFHDRTGKPIMLVLVRKDQPIESIDWNWDRKSVGGWFPGETR